MYKQRALFFYLLITLNSVTAQQNKIDSLEVALKGASTGKSKIDLLCLLADHYLASQPDKSKHYAEEALSQAIETDYTAGEIRALIHLGDYEFRQGNYAQAIQLSNRSLHLSEAIFDSTSMAMAYRILGNTNNIGFKRYDSALVFQSKALKIHQQRNDPEMMASICGSITWTYAMTNRNLKEAHRLADLGIHLSDSLGNSKFLSYNYNSKGLIYKQQNELDSALKYFDLSSREAQKTNNKAVIAFNKRLVASILFQQKKVDDAIALFHSALIESRALNLREVVKNSYEGLSQCYAAVGNYPLAYQYSTQYNQLQDSLLNAEITQKALLSELEFEETKNLAKIRELQSSNAQAKKEQFILRLLFGTASAFLLTVILLIMRNNRQRARANQLLHGKNIQIAQQNESLIKVNQTKDKLFSILGHDLRSPLSSLKGMLDLVLQKQISPAEFGMFLPKINQQVTGITETLENLLRWSQSQQQGWVTSITTVNLHGLIKKCFSLFSEIAKEKNITLVSAVAQPTNVLGDENQLELIFRNLIHNAIKFTNHGGTISLDARTHETFIHIQVKDTGIGMSPDQLKHLFELNKGANTRGTQGEKGTGLGLHLSFEMVKENGGRIEVTSSVGNGSTFSVYLKPGA